MNRRLFLLRFVVVAALSLLLFGLLLKPYTYFLGLIVRGALNGLTSFRVAESGVRGSWFKVTLAFVCEGRPMTVQAGFVAINLAAFVALVAATPGIGWRRVGRALSIGCGILFVWHLIQLSALLFAGVSMSVTSPAGLARLLATVSVVLPFGMWFFLAQPPQIFRYFAGERGEDSNIEQA